MASQDVSHDRQPPDCHEKCDRSYPAPQYKMPQPGNDPSKQHDENGCKWIPSRRRLRHALFVWVNLVHKTSDQKRKNLFLDRASNAGFFFPDIHVHFRAEAELGKIDSRLDGEARVGNDLAVIARL